MIGLTPKQSALLTFIECEMLDKGICPSYAEMAAHLGLSTNSRGFIGWLINGLEERGYLRRLPGRKRAIELLDPSAHACPHCWHPMGSAACRKAAASPKSYSHSPRELHSAGDNPGDGHQRPTQPRLQGPNSDVPVI